MCTLELDALLEKRFQRAQLCGEVFHELAVVAETTKETVELLDICRVGYVHQGAILVAIEAHAGWGDGVAEAGCVNCTDASFFQRRASGCSGGDAGKSATMFVM